MKEIQNTNTDHMKNNRKSKTEKTTLTQQCPGQTYTPKYTYNAKSNLVSLYGGRTYCFLSCYLSWAICAYSIYYFRYINAYNQTSFQPVCCNDYQYILQWITRKELFEHILVSVRSVPPFPSFHSTHLFSAVLYTFDDAFKLKSKYSH